MQAVSTPLSPSKFLHLKVLGISLHGAAFSPAYDCFSVVYFLDAAPSLETFVLGVSHFSSCDANKYPVFFFSVHCGTNH